MNMQTIQGWLISWVSCIQQMQSASHSRNFGREVELGIKQLPLNGSHEFNIFESRNYACLLTTVTSVPEQYPQIYKIIQWIVKEMREGRGIKNLEQKKNYQSANGCFRRCYFANFCFSFIYTCMHLLSHHVECNFYHELQSKVLKTLYY